MSGQRWLASGVELAPSVMESPNVTTARVCGAAATIMPLRNTRAFIVESAFISASPAKFPSGEMPSRVGALVAGAAHKISLD